MFAINRAKTTAVTGQKIFAWPLGLVYALPLIPLYFLVGPISILQAIYTKHFGLTLSAIATVILIARMFDALIDPVVGYVADRYYRRYGNRRPFIVSGGLLFVLSSWFLYVPTSISTLDATTTVTPEYFLVCFLAFYFAYTLFVIPHYAWGGELVSNSKEKNIVYSFRAFGMYLGTLLFFMVPLLPFFETNEFTPHTLRWSVLAAALLMLPMLYFCLKKVPDIPRNSSDAIHHSKVDGLGAMLHSVFANKPLMILMAAHSFTGFGSGMWFALQFLFVDTYLGLGNKFALVYVISFSLGIVTLKLWYGLANHLDKKSVWKVGMILVSIGSIATGFLSPSQTGWISLLCCMTLIFSGYTAFNIMVPSLISDIVDYGRWKFGRNYSATYFSLYTLINKTAVALGGALSFALAGWYGFDPTASVHQDETLVGLRLGVAWLPALFVVVSITFITRIPITGDRHKIILRRIESRSCRAAREVESLKSVEAEKGNGKG